MYCETHPPPNKTHGELPSEATPRYLTPHPPHPARANEVTSRSSAEMPNPLGYPWTPQAPQGPPQPHRDPPAPLRGPGQRPSPAPGETPRRPLAPARPLPEAAPGAAGPGRVPDPSGGARPGDSGLLPGVSSSSRAQAAVAALGRGAMAGRRAWPERGGRGRARRAASCRCRSPPHPGAAGLVRRLFFSRCRF